MADPDWLAERFETPRAHLRAVAYRMLGSMSEADDAVQDAWLRLARAVGAEQAEHLAGGDLEVDAPHRPDPAGVDLAEMTYIDRRIHLPSLLSWAAAVTSAASGSSPLMTDADERM